MGEVNQNSTKIRRDTRTLAGFTLIELLVVIVILGVLMGATVLNLNPGSDMRALDAYAQRMAQRIELARDRAIQNNQEWGLRVGREDYELLVFDDTSRQWVLQQQKPFQPDEPPFPITFDITVQENGWDNIDAEAFGTLAPTAEVAVSGPGNGAPELGDNETKVLPDVVFFSSGEASQFFVDVQPQGDKGGFRLATDGFSATSVDAIDPRAGGLQ